jgi:hydrogenase-4 component B
VPPLFTRAPGEPALPRAFLSDFRNIGAQVGRHALPGRGLVVLHRGGSANPVVFAMSTSYMGVALAALLGLTAGLVWLLAARKRRVQRRAAWAGGVREFLPEMAYTATGFAQPVRVIFEAVLRPSTVEDSRKAIAEHFRVTIRRLRQEVHVVDRLALRPAASAAGWVAERLAAMHHGRLNAYAAYVLLALVLFLCLVSFG